MSISAEVATLFVEELARRNIPVEVSDEGVYQIEVGDERLSISLENLTRDFETDRDPQRVIDFVDTVTQPVVIPDWDEARDRIRWNLEPTDMPIEEALHDLVSDQVARILVYVSPDETRIAWVTESMAERWGMAKESLDIVAAENMQALMAQAEITYDVIDEAKLGIIATDYLAFKAAFVFSPGFKAIVEPVLGWPVFALVPCRDFVFLVPEENRDFLGRVGGAVVKQYLESSYQLCTEVFEVTDDGAAAIGEFDKAPPDEPEIDDDGMKTIRYLGGMVTFRLPGHWEEDYDEDGGGAFFDEDSDGGTLRLGTITAKSQKPVTTHSSREIAEGWAREEQGTLTDLGGGTWMVNYASQTEEDGKPLTIHYWQIAAPCPPSHLLVAIFSYSVFNDVLDGDDVATELEMIDREVRAATFAPEIGE